MGMMTSLSSSKGKVLPLMYQYHKKGNCTLILRPMKQMITFLLFIVAFYSTGFGQSFTKRDSLRGGQRFERNCFDIHYYNLSLSINIPNKRIEGSNTVYFRTIQQTSVIQLDLFENMIIDSILFEGQGVSYRREYDAFFIQFPRELTAQTLHELTIYYHGQPVIGKMPPWDGGFTWTKDQEGKDWVAVSCQGKGASLWWPTKEDYSDEPDSMRIHINVPDPLIAVCNGTPEGVTAMNGSRTYHWKVSYPINNYNVTINVAQYVHWQDYYISADGDTLDLDYYVLPYNLDAAKKQFEQVKPMLECYEKYLGKYPFYKDGYALVETPYLGMEHQGAIAYGNKFRRGYLGMDRSGQNLDFDYIIIHETGHEWWGNSVSAKDLADMWIHESFCTYSEAIYVECRWGYDVALKYVNALKSTVSNTSPMIGIYGVNQEGNGDMYVKGMLFLNTLRHLLNDDDKWWSLIYQMSNEKFYHSTTNYDEVLQFFNEKMGKDITPVFEQYIKKKDIPELHYSVKKCKKGGVSLQLHWEVQTPYFVLPVEFEVAGKKYREDIGTKKVSFQLPNDDIKIDQEKYYFQLKKE